ncbi:MAG TPA: tRNA pseudouridine(38-40) synthase TruA [Chthoniobacteraceae bacterium]|nr:tRNA pseudouridine(38-40) synthase TruA [Chthoniobacteraceae bacterium]
MNTERLRLTIAYDGRKFRGWQSQATKDAVQDYLEHALHDLCGKRIVVQGSGRTDTGVHALAQTAHIEVPAGKFNLRTWMFAINSRLPFEVRIMRIQQARPGFHARFDAQGKVYAYRVWHGEFLHPLEIGRAWHVPGQLDLEVLRKGAEKLKGKHDFAAFAANRGRPEKDTVRTIHSIRISRRGPLITLRFEGDGFLYRMVRMMTGTMVRCAQGRLPLSRLDELLKSKGATKTTFAAPAEGLYLEKVLY